MVLTSQAIAHIGNTIDYCLQPSKISNVLHSDGLDLYGISIGEIGVRHDTSIVKAEFQLYQNKNLEKPYLSLILSPQIDVENEKLKEIVTDVLKEMKLDNHQMIAITHLEMRGPEEDRKPVKHVHILVNRVDYDGITFDDQYIGLKGIKVASKVALKHNLLDVYNNRKYQKEMVVKKGSKYHTKKQEIAIKLSSIVDPIIYKKTTHTIDDVFQELKNEHHVDIVVTKFNNGRFGVALNYQGETFQASNVSPYLTVIPNDVGDYTANKRLKPILDRNIEASVTVAPKTLKEIQADFKVHGNAELYHSQLVNLSAFINAMNHEKHKAEREEQYLSKKYGKKEKQLGFKIQI